MSDQNTERQGAREMPGGGSSRGPEYGTVGEPQVEVPPYDDLRGAPSTEGAEGVRKAFDASNAGEPGPGAEVAKEERDGMSSTAMNPEPPLGVGKSTSKGAEEQAPDRPDVRRRSADRSAGKADPDSDNPSVTPGSPGLQSGDQGG